MTVREPGREAASGRKLPSILTGLLGLLVLAVVICLGSEWICRVVLHATLPLYRTPLRVEAVRFPDLLAFYPRFALLHTEDFFTSTATNPFMYAAAAVPLYVALYAVAPHILAAYLTFSLLVLSVGALSVIRGLVRRGIGVLAAAGYTLLTMLCVYPIWFALSQANIEIFIWVLLAMGIALYWHRRGYAACVCFGLAAAIKIYPVLFLVLPLYRKRWGQAALGAVTAAAYSVGALIYVGPTLLQAFYGIRGGLGRFRTMIMLHILDVTGIDHSLFSLYKLVFRKDEAAGRFETALPIYLGLMVIAVLVLLATRVRRLPLANQLAFCVVVCVLCPPTSFEYTLMHIMTLNALFMFLLLDARRVGKQPPGLVQALACCTVCLSFLPELIHNGRQVDGAVKSLGLILLLYTVLLYPFPAVGADTALGLDLPGEPVAEAGVS